MTTQIEDEIFVHVEMRHLDEDSKFNLDMFSADNHIESMRLFNDLNGEHRMSEELSDLMHDYKSFLSVKEELLSHLDEYEPDSDDYIHYEALLEFNGDERRDTNNNIMKIINYFNQASGYNPKKGKIERKAMHLKRQSENVS